MVNTERCGSAEAVLEITETMQRKDQDEQRFQQQGATPTLQKTSQPGCESGFKRDW